LQEKAKVYKAFTAVKGLFSGLSFIKKRVIEQIILLSVCNCL